MPHAHTATYFGPSTDLKPVIQGLEKIMLAAQKATLGTKNDPVYMLQKRKRENHERDSQCNFRNIRRCKRQQ